MELKGSKTEQNLKAAFAGESQARNKYTYYASVAKKAGYEQVRKIFEVTGGIERFEKIEKFSKQKSEEMGIELTDELMNDYVIHIYSHNSREN